ncbi:universal stress protein [Bdellovibrio bacteriovorus]|uniref:universal stress protein n=1 Tax=Bdellovibrio bacteriovorus TaxID=959 RepID=UPI003D061B63
MAEDLLFIADDLAERSAKGRLRSRLLRDNSVEIARKWGLKIEYLYVVDLKIPLFKKQQFKILKENFDAIKGSVEEKYRKEKIPAEINILYGIPAEEILKSVRLANEARLLLIGTQGRKGIKKLLMGSVAEEVLRNTSTPVLVLGPKAQEKRKVLQISEKMKVLFLTDFSDSSDAAESFLISFCSKFKCPVLIAHSVGEQISRIRQSLLAAGDVPLDIERMFNQMTEDAQRDLQRKTRDFQKKGLKATSHLFVKEERLEASLKGLLAKMDLVVMGTRGRNKVLSSFVGSTARDLILNSPVPVVAIRNEED